MNAEVSPQLLGPWPDGTQATRVELAAYVDEVADGSLDPLPTRCEPWSVRDVTVHLTETFRRFQRMLDQGRTGDFTPPFGLGELDAENQRAVDAFTGDVTDALVIAVSGFLDELGSLDEPVPHQMGTLPAGLQVLFGLLDLALHHDDVAAAAGRSYRPAPETVEAVAVVAERLFGMPPDQPDPWPLIVVGSGRPPV